MKDKEMFEKKTDSELLALLRTMFALERNYLAEERTILAKLRAGLALTLFASSLYIYSIALSWVLNIFFLILFYSFLILCGFEGSRLMIHSRSDLKKCRRLKNLVLVREKEILSNSVLISELFIDIINNSSVKNNKGIKNNQKKISKLKKIKINELKGK
jgi:uncharacterized membrane protein YidH (DUF202 family)